MPDTFDVDHAFEALAHDVMHRAAPPSAVHAIKQARGRRRATLATSVAAALVVAAGVVVPTMLGGDDSSRVAEHDGLRSLPTGATFPLAGWEPYGRHGLGPHGDGRSDSACAAAWLAKAREPGPLYTGQTALARGDDRLLTKFADFGSGSEDKAISYSAAPPADCGVPTTAVHYDGGEVLHFTGTERGPSDLWVVRFGAMVALAVLDSDAPATLGERTRIGDSLMAALVLPMLWPNFDTDPAATSPPDVDPDPVMTAINHAFSAEINPAAIDQAFGSWFPAWRDGMAEGGVLSRYCNEGVADDPGTFEWSGGTAVVWLYRLKTAEAATKARATLLSGCESPQWSVAEIGASGSIATSAAGNYWVVQSGGLVAELRVMDAANPPPEVISDVAALLTRALQNAQAVQEAQ